MRFIKILSMEFLMKVRWKQKLKSLNATRPNLLRSEYLSLVSEKGYQTRNIKVVYDVIKEYLSFEEFSMYPEDDISIYYLRGDSDIEGIIKRIFGRLKTSKQRDKCFALRDSYKGPLTVVTILDMIKSTAAQHPQLNHNKMPVMRETI